LTLLEEDQDEEAKGKEGAEKGKVSETGFNQAQETEGYYCWD
jgi:hypothetical protein